MTPIPPEGWYPDPESPGGMRYWDGHQWTTHQVSPLPQPHSVPPAASKHAQGAGPTKPVLYKRPWVWVAGAVALLVMVGSIASATGRKAGRAGAPSPSASSAPRTSTISGGEEDNLSGPGAPTVSGPVVAPGSGQAAGQSGCRSGDPLANVYHPNRLKVVLACTTISGTVKTRRSEDDGDVHFDVALDSQYAGMLTSANYSAQHRWLVVEIVPADEPGCTPGQSPKPATGTYNYGICTGADESTPAVGSHIYVTGPYVLDEDHGGWAEVHPAWAISSTLTPSATAPLQTTTPPTTPPTTQAIAPPTTAAPPPPTSTPTGCYPTSSSGSCYKAGQLCPNAYHGTTGVAGNGEHIICLDNNGWRWEPY